MAALTRDAVKAINIEIPTLCNAGCPFCSRRQKVRPCAGQLVIRDRFFDQRVC